MRTVLLCLAVACVWGCNAGDGGDVSGGDVDIEAKVADGTWTDPTSGLIWQVTPPSDYHAWEEAKSYCNSLTLQGHSDWRLPDIGELRSLIRGCAATTTGGTCNVEQGDCLAWSCRDSTCDGCHTKEGPGDGGMYWPDDIEGDYSWYWSSSPVEDDDNVAWGVFFYHGLVGYGDVNIVIRVRCVRDAP